MLDYSLPLIFAAVMVLLGVSKAKKVMKSTGLNARGLLTVVRFKAELATSGLLTKLVSSTLVTVVISLLSYRTLWNNNVFHVLILSLFIMPHIRKAVKYVLE